MSKKLIFGFLLLGVYFTSQTFASPAIEEIPSIPIFEQEVEPIEKSTAEVSSPAEKSTEKRSCGTCGLTAATSVSSVKPTALFPGLVGGLGVLGDSALLALGIPVLILQVITLSILAYLLKNEKSYYDGDDTGYYAAYPVNGGGSGHGGSGHGGSGYRDSYSSYRSLVPDEDTMTWILGKVSEGIDLYHQYQEETNAIHK